MEKVIVEWIYMNLMGIINKTFSSFSVIYLARSITTGNIPMTILKYSIFLFSWVMSIPLLRAQNEHLINYGLREGLPQSQVYDIVQDSIGFLWLGTQGGGLASFDGEDFEVYSETEGLLSNFIYALHTKGDTLFIGTNKGLSIKVNHKFHNYPCPSINKIVQLGGTTYYLTEKGIWQYAVGNIRPATTFSTFKNTPINDLYFDGQYYWVASRMGLWRIKNFSQKPVSISREDFTAIISTDTLTFAASFVEGIFVFQDGEPIDTLTNIKRINSLTINDGALWIATDNKGVIIYDIATQQIKKQLNKKSGLKTTLHIRKCLKDRQANIWVATSGGGLYKYAPTNFTHFTTTSGLLGNRVYALAKQGNAVIASNSENGLMNMQATSIRKIEDFGFLNSKVKTIATDSAGTIWAGTNGKGILIIKKEILRDTIYLDSLALASRSDSLSMDSMQIITDTITVTDTLSKEMEGLPSDWIRKIVLDSHSIWVATYSSGIAQLIQTDSLVYQVKTYGIKQGIKDLYINDLVLDSLGRIWYSTRNGALGYIENNRVQHTSNILDKKVSIGSILLKDEQLFLGTIGEGIWWSAKKDPLIFYPLAGEKELFSDNIYQLIFDEEGYLWAGSEKGVDRIQLNSSTQIVDVFHYGPNDGFLGIETCLNAIEKDAEGNIWFGTINGLTKYQAAIPIKKIEQPAIYFSDLELVYEKVDSIEFEAHITRPLKVPPTKRHLSLTFRTVDLNHPENIEYQYRLNGEEWSKWSPENKVIFPNLEYGNYTFQVQSRNIDWTQSDPIQFQFTVLTPWYKQQWVRALAVGLLLLLIGGIIYRHIRRLKSKNKAAVEKLEVQNHLLSLEQKALQLQMNPHFIFNVLNGIKSMGIKGDTASMNTTINTFATLLRGILNNSRQEQISLAQEIKTLQSYIQLEQQIQTKSFTYDLQTTVEFDTEEIMIPPMLVQPFVENGIRHGISAVKREGKLTIIFSTKNDFLHCEILDNGIGIEQSKKQGSIKNHQSVALQVTKERVASLSKKANIKIEEIVEGDRIKGTKVWFKIPLLLDF